MTTPIIGRLFVEKTLMHCTCLMLDVFKNHIKTKHKSSKIKATGFTITELLIVIVIIAILAAIAIVIYSGLVRKAEETSVMSDTKNSANQMQAHKILKGAFPANCADSGARASEGNTLTAWLQLTVKTSVCLLCAEIFLILRQVLQRPHRRVCAVEQLGWLQEQSLPK